MTEVLRMIPGMVVIALSDTLALQLLKQMVNAGDILRFGLLLSIVMLSVGPQDLYSASRLVTLLLDYLRLINNRCPQPITSDPAPKLFLID